MAVESGEISQGNRMNSRPTKSEELLTVFIRRRRNQPAHLDASLARNRDPAESDPA